MLVRRLVGPGLLLLLCEGRLLECADLLLYVANECYLGVQRVAAVRPLLALRNVVLAGDCVVDAVEHIVEVGERGGVIAEQRVLP